MSPTLSTDGSHPQPPELSRGWLGGRPAMEMKESQCNLTWKQNFMWPTSSSHSKHSDQLPCTLKSHLIGAKHGRYTDTLHKIVPRNFPMSILECLDHWVRLFVSPDTLVLLHPLREKSSTECCLQMSSSTPLASTLTAKRSKTFSRPLILELHLPSCIHLEMRSFRMWMQLISEKSTTTPSMTWLWEDPAPVMVMLPDVFLRKKNMRIFLAWFMENVNVIIIPSKRLIRQWDFLMFFIFLSFRGNNCEHCMDFYHDVPWSPATGKLKNECKKCNCNEHTDKCHFDSRVFAVSLTYCS